MLKSRKVELLLLEAPLQLVKVGSQHNILVPIFGEAKQLGDTVCSSPPSYVSQPFFSTTSFYCTIDFSHQYELLVCIVSKDMTQIRNFSLLYRLQSFRFCVTSSRFFLFVTFRVHEMMSFLFLSSLYIHCWALAFEWESLGYRGRSRSGPVLMRTVSSGCVPSRKSTSQILHLNF